MFEWFILGATVKLENINDDDPLDGSYYDGGSNDDDESCGNNFFYDNRPDLKQSQGPKVSLKRVLIFNII